MTELRFVGCFDILGFKGIVETAKLEWLVKAFELVLKKVNAASIVNMVWGKSPTINFKVFSDSIFFWTDDNSEESFIELCMFADQLIMSCINTGICIRGSITRGELYAKDDVIIGKAIVRAYQLEQNQRWVGCWIDPNLLNDEAIKNLIFQHEPLLFVKYDIPTKDGIKKGQYVINWVLVVFSSSIFVKQSLEDAINTVFHWVTNYSDDGVEDKKKNTIEFLIEAKRTYENAAES